MHRWFPAPAALALVLWAVAVVGLVAGSVGRTVAGRADRAALATLGVHAGAILWFAASRGRPAAGVEPGWVRVQEAKHRRKATWFAVWGLAVLAVGWATIRLASPGDGRAGPAAWFGSSLNLGFQPGMFLAEWAAIVAAVRLGRSVAGRGPG